MAQAVERAKTVTIQELNSLIAQADDAKYPKFPNGAFGLSPEQLDFYKQMQQAGMAAHMAAGPHGPHGLPMPPHPPGLQPPGLPASSVGSLLGFNAAAAAAGFGGGPPQLGGPVPSVGGVAAAALKHEAEKAAEERHVSSRGPGSWVGY